MSIKKLSCIVMYLSFFCILLSSKGWCSVPLGEGEIPVFSQDAFDNLHIRRGGSSLSCSDFREISTGQIWIGKANGFVIPGATHTLDRESIESLSCREKIASDIYGRYGVAVPRTVLSPQQMTNTGVPDFEGQVTMHIMSSEVEHYHDYRNQTRFTGFYASIDPTHGPIICHDNSCTRCIVTPREGYYTAYKTEGIGRIAAVATWIHDIDFMGPSASNTGYQIIRRPGQVIAELMVVDPGESFSDPAVFPYPAPRYIRFAMPGREDTNTIAFEMLCPAGSRTRDEFFTTLRAIIDTDERTIVRFFTRRGAEFFVSRDPRSVQGLTRQLMKRKEQLAIDYAPELAAARGVLPLPPAIPDIARGEHEYIYRRFINGRLIYKPDPSSDTGKIEMLFADVVDPITLEGKFNLLKCGDTGTYLNISTGYRRERRTENVGKVEVWIVPKFMIERDRTTTARHLEPIMSSFSEQSSVGLFWTLGDWDREDWYDYLVTCSISDISSRNIYENWRISGSKAGFGSTVPSHIGTKFYTLRF